jgi:hypothetical protein
MAAAWELNLSDLSFNPPGLQQEFDRSTMLALRSYDAVATVFGMSTNLVALRYISREQVANTFAVRAFLALQSLQGLLLVLAPNFYSAHRNKVCVVSRAVRLLDVGGCRSRCSGRPGPWRATARLLGRPTQHRPTQHRPPSTARHSTPKPPPRPAQPITSSPAAPPAAPPAPWPSRPPPRSPPPTLACAPS